MLPYLAAAIVLLGLPTIYIAVQSREYRKFLAGAFFVSSGMQFYFYAAQIPVPLIWTNAVQSPQLSALRGAIHFVLFLICLYFGWFSHPRRSSTRQDTRKNILRKESTLKEKLSFRLIRSAN